MKPAFSAEELRTRQIFARELLDEMGLMQALRVRFWRCVVQCDEGRWTYSTKQGLSRKVLLDKRTTLLHDYITCDKIEGEEEATVHFFICVSPHPKFEASNGLVWWDFTTGTTNIRRLRNTLDQTVYEPFEYTVSYWFNESACCHACQ